MISPDLASKPMAMGFLVELKNQGRRFVSDLASKSLRRFLPVWPQNRSRRVSWLSLKTKVNDLPVVWPQNYWDGFFRFGLKTGGDGFS
jgi:hypothetical protein